MIQSVARPGEKQVFVQGDVTKMLTRLLIGMYVSLCASVSMCVCVCVSVYVCVYLCMHACVSMYVLCSCTVHVVQDPQHVLSTCTDSYGLPPKYIEQENKVHKAKKKGK